MSNQNRFFIVPVVVTALAVVAMFSVPPSNAREANADPVATGCPHAGFKHGSAQHLAYQQWLMLHVHGLHPQMQEDRVERHTPVSPAYRLLEVSHDINPAQARDAHVVTF